MFLSQNPFKKWFKKQVKTADFVVDKSAVISTPPAPPVISTPINIGEKSPATTSQPAQEISQSQAHSIEMTKGNYWVEMTTKAKEAVALEEKILEKKVNKTLIHEEKLLQKKLKAIERSTKTLFPFFHKPHNFLMQTNRHYASWHLQPYAIATHYATLILVFSLAVFSVWTTFTQKTQAGVLGTTQTQESKLSVTEITIDKNPDKFYLQDETTKEYTKAYTVEETADGTKIKTKSATDAGFQQLLVNGNDSTLYDGDKLVAQAQVKTEEKNDQGEWQEIGVKSSVISISQNPSVISTPKNIGEKSPVTTSQPAQEISQSQAHSIEMTQGMKALAEDAQTITKELKSTSITKQETDKVTVDNSATLENGTDLNIQVEAGLTDYSSKGEAIDLPAGEAGKSKKSSSSQQASNDKTPLNKQTFSLDNKDKTTKRLSWVVKLNDFDIKDNSSVTIPDAKDVILSEAKDLSATTSEDSSAKPQNDNTNRARTYASTVIDCSDYTGPMTWVENKDTDTVIIYFDEAGTTEDILIDPILTVTQPTNQIVVNDGTHKWVFDSTKVGAPRYYYDARIGNGNTNLTSPSVDRPFIGPAFNSYVTQTSGSQSILENTSTRIKIETQGTYSTSPTSIDNIYTIYPDGRAFLSYNGVSTQNIYVDEYSTGLMPEVWNRDNTNNLFVTSDITNNNYPGMSVIPYTISEFGGVGAWGSTNDAAQNQFWRNVTGTLTGNMAIDFSNYRATTTTRDALMNEYRNPAALANFVKGTQTGDGFAEGEGAYTVTADASGDAKFDLQPGSYPRLKPVITIADATRSEDNYQVQIGGVLKTKGIDYNLSKSSASTVELQLLSTVSANTTLEVSNGGNNNVWTNGSTDGNWSTAGNWSLGNVPLSTDNVVFGSVTANCSIDATAVANTLTIAPGYTGTVTANAGLTVSSDFSLESGTFNATTFTINVGGNWSRVGGTFTYGTSTVKMTNTAGTKTVTSGGQSFYNFTMDGVGGTTQFVDAFSLPAAGTLTLINGTLNTNNQAVSVGYFASPNNNIRTINLGSSNITVTGTGNVWDFTITGNLTFNCDTSIITFTGSSANMNPGVRTYATVNFTGAGTPVITRAGTFGTLTRTGTAITTDVFQFSGNVTVTGTLIINGSSSINRVLATSNTLGTPRTITAAAVVLSNVDFRDITFAGTMAVTSASSIGDCGGNSGANWNSGSTPIVTAATTQTWDGTANLWSSAHWTSHVPLPQDTVILAGTNTVTADMPRLGKDISFTGATPLTLSVSVTSFGSLNFTNAGTFTSSPKYWYFAGRGAYLLTSAGKSFYVVMIQAPGGSLTAQDATSISSFIVYNGNFDHGIYSVTLTSQFAAMTGTAKTISGSGPWTILANQIAAFQLSDDTTWNDTGNLNFTYAGAINCNYSFGTSRTLSNNITFTGGGTGIVNIQATTAVTFNGNVTIGSPKTVTFPSGVTTTINGTFTANGTSGSLITINSSTPASAATIAHAGNITTQWNSIKDITSTGGTWNASFSTSVSGNTGITFPAYSARVVRSTGGNYSDASTWESASGLKDTVAVPTASDDVFLDAQSGQLTINANMLTKAFDCTGYTGILTHNAYYLKVAGNLTFVPGMTYNAVAGSRIILDANNIVLTSGSKLLPTIYVYTWSGIVLGDNVTFINDKNVIFAVYGNNFGLNGKTISGYSSTSRVLIQSDTLGTPRTITVNGGTFANADFRDIAFANGGANLDLSAITGLSGNCGGNAMSGGGTLTLTAPVPQAWTNVNGGNWSLNTNWTSRVPLPQDDVSFPLAFGTSKTVHADMPRLGKTIDWSGATYTTALTFALDNDVTNYGGLNLTGISAFSGNRAWYFESNDRTGTKYITSNGKSFPSVIASQVVGSTLQLNDALSAVLTLRIYDGTFIDNGNTVSAYLLDSVGSTRTRSVVKTGNWILTSSLGSALNVVSNGLTWSDTAGSITISDTGASAKTFAGGGLTYYDLNITGGGSGAVIFTGANTFNNVTIGSPKTVTFPSGVTTTINGTFTANGTAQPTKIINGATLNGNLDTWSSDTNAANWGETLGGTSTVNKESSIVNTNGGYAARVDVDSSGNRAGIYADVLTLAKRYKITFYAKVSDITDNPQFRVYMGSGTQVYPVLTTSYIKYTYYLTATTDTLLRLYTYNNCASKSIYIDDVTLEESADVELNASTPGSAATLSKATGIVAPDYAGVKDTTVTGGAKWYLGNNSTNISGNTGWLVDAAAPTDPTTTTANVDGTPITNQSWITQAGTINYAFSGSTDPDSGIAGYYTYFGTNASADPVTWQAQITDPQTYSTPITTADDGKHFYFRIKTKDAVGNVGIATTLFDFGYDITLPTRPTFVAATPAGYTTDNSYTFSWPVAADPASANGASGIKWYEYKRATDVSWSHTADATTRTVSGIESYQQGPNAFYVRTVDNANNISPTYQQVTYYFSGVVPNIPTALNVDPTISDTNEFTISWDKSTLANAGDPPVVGYYYSINAAPTLDNVTYVASQEDHISIGHSPFATKQGENTVYVLAVNSIGGLSYEEDHVAHAHFTCQTSALPAPVNVALSDSSNRLYNTWSLTVKWQDELAQADPTFHHYSVERSTNGTDFTALPMSNTTIDPNVPAPEPSTAIIDIGLDNSTLYYYRVKAVDNAGKESAPSSIVSKMPTGKYLTPPTILSAPTVSDIKSVSAKITWMTDRSSSSIVRYSQNNPATGEGVFESSFGQYDSVTTHTVPLPTLNPSTTYYYQVQSIDELKEYDSNSAFSQTYTFTTALAPAISATTVSNITLSTADITFDTTTVSTATISYGLIQDVYGTDIADISGASTTKHTVKLTGLSAGTVYNFRIKGTDIEDNILTSDNYSFETLPLPQVEDLKIEAIPGRPRSAFKASWLTNVPTSTILRYSTDGSDWQETVKAKNEKAHSVEISGLEDDVAYSIIASGRDEIGNLTTSPTEHFTTPYDTRPPEITDLNIETSMVGTGTGLKAQVTVGWKTDEVAIGKIEYGTGTDGPLTDSTTENSGLSMEKSTIISNLDPSRPYHLKVIVTDKAGNKTESDNQVFITNEVRRSAWDLIKSALNNIFGFWFAQYK